MIDYEEAAQSYAGFRPQEKTLDQRSTSFRFSLQLCIREGVSVKGDMTMSKTGTSIPSRASKPVAPVTVDVDQEYDDRLDTTPPSTLRFRSTMQPATKPRTTGPIVAPITHRVSGGTRFLLWVVLVLCVVFLTYSLVLPAINDALTQWKYGDSRIATYDLDNHHWVSQEDKGRLRIVVSNEDGSHSQQLVTPISGVANHALVTLDQTGNKIEVSVNGTYAALIVPDGQGGYKWGSTN